LRLSNKLYKIASSSSFGGLHIFLVYQTHTIYKKKGSQGVSHPSHPTSRGNKSIVLSWGRQLGIEILVYYIIYNW